MNIGLSEILVILGVILLVFGPNKLPELSRAVGRSIGEFKRSMRDMEEQIQSEPAEQAQDALAEGPDEPVKSLFDQSAEIVSDSTEEPARPGEPPQSQPT